MKNFICKLLFFSFFAVSFRINASPEGLFPLEKKIELKERALYSFLKETQAIISGKMKEADLPRWDLLRNSVLFSSLQEAFTSFEFIINYFKREELFYNPEIEHAFFKMSDFFSGIEEIKPRHLRKLRSRILRFNKYLKKYIRSRKDFLKERDFVLIGKIQRLNDLLVNDLLKEELLDLAFEDKFFDKVFYRPWEVVCENKEIVISGLAITGSIGLFFLWPHIKQVWRKIFSDKNNPPKVVYFANKGLKNDKNICFMNSVIQCLPDVSPLREAILKALNIAQGDDDEINVVVRECAALISNLRDEDIKEGDFYPKSFIENALPNILGPNYKLGTQEDAQEFLVNLLNRLEKNTEKFVLGVVNCANTSSVSCGEADCRSVSEMLEPGGAILSVEIPKRRKVTKLTDDCLDKHFEKEMLTGRNSYRCGNCRRLVDAEKQLRLNRAPEVLIVHLNRFRFNKRTKKREKVKTAVSFPDKNLDMKNYVVDGDQADNSKYDLVGFVCHSGRSAYGGHYISLSKDHRTNQWYKYNDSYVTPVSDAQIERITSEGKHNGFDPYILFYQRKSLEEEN